MRCTVAMKTCGQRQRAGTHASRVVNRATAEEGLSDEYPMAGSLMTLSISHSHTHETRCLLGAGYYTG